MMMREKTTTNFQTKNDFALQEAVVRTCGARRRAAPSVQTVAAAFALLSLGLFWENNLFGRIFSGFLISIPITYAIGNAAHIGGISLSRKQCVALATSTLLIAVGVLYSFTAPGL